MLFSSQSSVLIFHLPSSVFMLYSSPQTYHQHALIGRPSFGLFYPKIFFCSPKHILSGIPPPVKAPTLRISPQSRGTRSLANAWTTTFPRVNSPRSTRYHPTRSEPGSARLGRPCLRLTRNPFTRQTGRLRLEGGLQGRNLVQIFFPFKNPLLTVMAVVFFSPPE